jgi:AhpD family alkylhydroperoxidase
MSDHFYPTDGTKALKKLRDLKPDTFKAFVEFDKKAFEEGALNVKTKELIAIAVGHVTQCPYCIDVHTKKAVAAGATEQEVAESIFVAIALRAGGSFAHSSIAMHAIEHK